MTGSTGGGAGGTGMSSPYQQQQQNTFDNAVKKNATATAGAVGSSTPMMDTGHGSAKNPTIYLGAGSRIAYMGQAQAQNLYYTWDNKTRNKFLSQLSLAGYKTDKLQDAQLAALWAGYVETAGKYSLAGKWVSPWEVIGKDIAQVGGAAGAASRARTVTSTQKTYNISTAEDAHALFQGAAQTLLGRDPTKSEIARFKSVLNKFEQATPAMTTTTAKYNAEGDLTSQTSKTTGGVSAAAQQLMAQEEAKKNPEYGAYQAATSGMNWLMEMIGGG